MTAKASAVFIRLYSDTACEYASCRRFFSIQAIVLASAAINLSDYQYGAIGDLSYSPGGHP